jgi:hypothetical protein
MDGIPTPTPTNKIPDGASFYREADLPKPNKIVRLHLGENGNIESSQVG